MATSTIRASSWRSRLMACAIVLLGTLSAAQPATADGVTAYGHGGSFDDAAFEVENAIVDRGLVIDYVSHVGAMLDRTKADVGGGKDLFKHARIYVFCSSIVSRAVIEADPMNVAYCPYGIFVAEAAAGGVTVGYRNLPAGPMQQVQELLDAIAREATGQ